MIGECKHVFHMHCITGWLASEGSQGRCPMCRQPYKEKVAESKQLNELRTPDPENGPQRAFIGGSGFTRGPIGGSGFTPEDGQQRALLAGGGSGRVP